MLEQFTVLTDFPRRDQIIEIRHQKEHIADCVLELRNIDAVMKQLNTLIFQKDIETATSQLSSQSLKLKERMIKAKSELTKILKSGKDLDGNTSNNEEEEFISELRNGE